MTPGRPCWARGGFAFVPEFLPTTSTPPQRSHPFLAGIACALWVAHGETHAAYIAGISLSTTSVAVVYAVMLETGLNRTELGKLILAACFITDFGTVLALTRAQYTVMATTVIASAVIPTLIAQRYFSPTHLPLAAHTSEFANEAGPPIEEEEIA